MQIQSKNNAKKASSVDSPNKKPPIKMKKPQEKQKATAQINQTKLMISHNDITKQIKIIKKEIPNKKQAGSQDSQNQDLKKSGNINQVINPKNIEKIQEQHRNITPQILKLQFTNDSIKTKPPKPQIRIPFKAQYIKKEQRTAIMGRSQIYCPVCSQKIYQHKITSIDKCKHSLHLQCVLPYLQMKISEATLEIRCPWTSCDSILSQKFLRQILHKQDLQKYYRFSSYMFIQKHKKNEWIQCTQPNCNEIFIKKNRTGYSWYICNTSKFKICIKCNKNYHPKFNDCNDYLKSLDPNSNEAKLMEMMQKNGWKQCPKCKLYVEKNQGCNHITCKCKNQFCYACQGPYPNCYCLKNARV